MAVNTGDLVTYCSANMPESDAVTSGGAINSAVKATFVDIQSNGNIKVSSTAGGDTSQTVTTYGRNSSGVIISESLNLNGTNLITGSANFSRIMKCAVSASHAGTINVNRVSDNLNLISMESGVTGIRRLFYNATAEAAGGNTKVFYEQVYLKNNNTGSALLNGTISELADTSNFVGFGLASGFNTSISITGRAGVGPTGVSAFDNTAKNMPGSGNLLPNENLAIWLQLSVPAGTAPNTGSWTFQVNGATA